MGKISVLRVRDKEGNVIDISAIRGPKGPPGKDGSPGVDGLTPKPKAGFIYPLASTTIPEGFLLCDGAEYSRVEYPELFAAIGTHFGAGDDENTFRVPDLRGRVSVGADDSIVNYVIATDKGTGVDVAAVIYGIQAIPLGVEYGGTGATDAKRARELLGITPQNIEALPSFGGTMNGYIDFGKNSNGLSWTTKDGTIIHLRPYYNENEFQITMRNPEKGIAEYAPLTIYPDGRMLLGGSVISGVKSMNGLRAGVIRFEPNGTDWIDIPVPTAGPGKERWSALISITDSNGCSSLWRFSGDSSIAVQTRHVINDNDAPGPYIDLNPSSTTGFMSVKCHEDNCVGWYIVNT